MAIITPPESNLPPESMQWGRSVDQNIINLDNNAARNFANIDNQLQQLNAAMELLNKQTLKATEYVLFDSGSYLFSGGAGWPWQEIDKTTFTATGSNVLITMVVAGSFTGGTNTAIYWDTAVSIDGLLTASGNSFNVPQPINLIGGGPYTGGTGVDYPMFDQKTFILNLPNGPGDYVIAQNAHGYGNMGSDVTLNIESSLITIRNL